MSFSYRALLFVIRKPAKTLIMFLILLVIGTLALSGLSIKSATETAQLNVRQMLGGMFALTQNTSDASKWASSSTQSGTRTYYIGMPIDTELGDYITENVRGINGYNAHYKAGGFVPKTADGGILELVTTEGADLSLTLGMASMGGELGSMVSGFACTNTNFDNLFAGGYVRLVEGRHIIPSDTNAVIVGKEFAELNGLKVGDTIILQEAEYYASVRGVTAEKVEVEIVGLFEATTKSTAVFLGDSIENSIYMTLPTFHRIRPGRSEESYESMYFYVNDPGEIDSIISEIEALPKFDPSDFVINVDRSEAESVAKPLANMDRLITVLIILTLAVGAVVLYLVLASRIKERVHESGILLSIGTGKAKIIGQYLLEVALIAVVAFGASVFCSGILAQTVGNQMLEYSMSDIETNANMPPQPDSGDGVTIVTDDMFRPQFEGKGDLTKIQVSVSSSAIVMLYLFGFLIICAAVILAVLPVLNMKPKKILSKHD